MPGYTLLAVIYNFKTIMRRVAILFFLSFFVTLLTACATHPDYANQFRFPIEWGSISEGQKTFLEMECHQCHTVNGVELASYEGNSPVKVELGG